MEYKMLDINEVELDINNPRIKQWIEIYKDEELTSEAISLALSASAGGSSTSTYTTLRESVRVNKGIINPIIVNRYMMEDLSLLKEIPDFKYTRNSQNWILMDHGKK